MRSFLFFLTLLSFLASCGFVDDDGIIDHCTQEEADLLKEIEEGDLNALKEFVKGDRDANFRCRTTPTGRGLFPGQRSLVSYVAASESYDVISYYLRLNPDQVHKNRLLDYYYQSDKDGITRLIIKKGAYYDYACIGLDTTYFDRLLNLGYDINKKDKEFGETVFLSNCQCPCPDGNEGDVIEYLRFLIRRGADVNLVNANGEDKLDLAVNPKIKSFLSKL